MSIGIDRDQICQLIERVAEGLGYEFVDLEIKGSGKNSILRIFIDKADGVSHQDCKLISDQVGTELDVEDLIPFSYTLEVSSPGLDRKLVRERDYVRFDGKRVKVQTRVPLHHQKVFRGRLRGVESGKVRLEQPNGEVIEIPLDVIHETRLEFDWADEKARTEQSEEAHE